jgi:hypothetical protein
MKLPPTLELGDTPAGKRRVFTVSGGELVGDRLRGESMGAAPLLRSRVVVTVELDKPTVISRIDDPDGNSSFTIELTATRIKER